MIMKRMFLTIALTAISAFGLTAEEKSKVYDFGDITGINAGGSYHLHITEGRSGKVEVVYDSSIEEYITLDVRYSGGNLHLFTNQMKKLKSWTNNTEVHVYLEMDDVRSIDLSGAAKARFEGDFKTENLILEISGAASLNEISIKGQNLEAEISGAASAGITGNFKKKIDIDLSGAAKLSMVSDSESLEADITGASKMKYSGNFNECEINCSGASNVELSGNAVKAEYDCSGASFINAENLIARNVNVELTGASKAKVNASENLYYNVSRGSKMTYYGKAELHNVSSDSNVVKGN